MPYRDSQDGHRLFLDNILEHCRQIFEKGMQLEAVLVAHEYLEQKLNNFYRPKGPVVHRKFKNIIDILLSDKHISESDYAVLNEFNRLRNVCSHRILDEKLELRGAKKGDVAKAMDLAKECDTIIAKLAARKRR
jgi:uncharacterized protein YutE (UPF0331/DUF86 family)